MTEREGASTGCHVLTVDVEEYFQTAAFDPYVDRAEWDYLPSRVELSVGKLAEFLDRHSVRATFFVLGWIARRYPEMVRSLVDRGHEVASYGWDRRPLTELSRETFQDEVQRSRALLEDITGEPVHGFRAPDLSLVSSAEWALEVLAAEGFAYDSSIYPSWRIGHHNAGVSLEPHVVRSSAGEILELPVTTCHFAGISLAVAGDCDLRFLPDWLVSKKFGQMGNRGVTGVLHIKSWELDDSQPRLPTSWLSEIRHYRGRDRMFQRLHRLLRENRFTSVERRFGLSGGGGRMGDGRRRRERVRSEA